MQTSVIVTVYNRPEMLIACLQALSLQTRLPDEVVISDDGSNARAVARMQSVFGEMPFPVRYVYQEDLGYRLAAARNNAIRAASGEYIVSIDCDILLLPDALATHLRHARSGRFLAANRALLSEQVTREALEQVVTPTLLEKMWDSADRKHLQRVHRQFTRNLWLRRIGLAAAHKPKILGCHFSLFRADIEKINGFDEQFKGWGLEDDDFARRLHMAAVRGRSLILQARALHLWHMPSDSAPVNLKHSPNWNYFKHPNVSPRCQHGLN